MKSIDRIRQILQESVNPSTITTIDVWDFDGTLINSPVPETGIPEYEKITGKKWPHKGWWSKPESLDMSIFEMAPIPGVISAYREAKKDPNTLNVMMTGRLPKLQSEVENILNLNNLKFDLYLYNNGGSTLQFKIDMLNELLTEYLKVNTVNQWDDRLEHIPAFQAWGNQQKETGRLSNFNITVVDGNHHGPK